MTFGLQVLLVTLKLVWLCLCMFLIFKLRVSERFDKTIVSAWKIAVSMILCNGTPAVLSFGF